MVSFVNPVPPCDAALLMSELVPLPTPIDLDRYARGILDEDDRQIFFQCLDRDRLGLVKLPVLDEEGDFDAP